MIPAPSRPRRARTQTTLWPRRLSAVLSASLLAIGIVPVVDVAAAAPTLTLKPNASAWAKVGPSRTTQIAEAVVTTPATAVDFGLQFRAKTKASGYRTKVTIAANGSVSGAFSRVTSHKQTKLSGGGPLGFSVTPGQRIHLEATAAAKKTVRLYLRAWKEGASKPTGWQLVAKDSSSKRNSKPGALYLWARTPSGSPKAALAYTMQSVARFSLAEASRIGQPAAPPRPSVNPNSAFSIAVIGDTQIEAESARDPRFTNRTTWLAASKKSLNLRYALHTGDMVNWGWLVPSQYTNARNAMSALTRAGIPYSLAIGNHDTRAVGWNGVKGSTEYGGAAYAFNPECVKRLGAIACDTKKLVRNTTEFNATFPLRGLTADIGGAFESGKIDNSWTTFSAGGAKWLVLSLEFAPRRTAVDWARKVVASHPRYNVILTTHYYLSASGKISGSNAGYGENSGKYIYDRIVSKYPNVKIVTSGHVGKYTRRTDTIKGNKVISYLGDRLGPADNPVRILTINTKTGVIQNTVLSRVTTSGTTKYSTGKDTIKVIR